MHSNDEGMGSEGVGFERARAASGTRGIDAVSALTDDDLLAGTRRLVCQSNRVLAALLAHLAEVEARGLHRKRACASLYIYCIYELRMSEDAAYRRVAAARLVKRFPLLFGAIERGELHLTALLLLASHLTEANLVEVLARAKFRTKKEIMKLVRLLSPLPDVPSRIEPLGLERRPAPRATWANLMAARCPVRELQPDERPGNWLPPPEKEEDFAANDHSAVVEPALARNTLGASTEVAQVAQQPPPASPARVEETERHLDGPQRFKVQFTASEEYVALVEEAKALLARGLPQADIAEIHLRAMQTLVAELKKRKYATTTRDPQASAKLQSERRRFRRRQPAFQPRRHRPNHRASAGDTCLPKCGAPSSNATATAAPTSTRVASAVARPHDSSFIITTPSPVVDPQHPKTFRCTVRRTTHSKRKKTSGKNTRSRSGASTLISRSEPFRENRRAR